MYVSTGNVMTTSHMLSAVSHASDAHTAICRTCEAVTVLDNDQFQVITHLLLASTSSYNTDKLHNPRHDGHGDEDEDAGGT